MLHPIFILVPLCLFGFYMAFSKQPTKPETNTAREWYKYNLEREIANGNGKGALTDSVYCQLDDKIYNSNPSGHWQSMFETFTA